MKLNYKSNRGLSALEVIVALGIIFLISAAIFTGELSYFRSARELDAETDQVVSLLRQARAKTLASEDDSAYGVRFEDASSTLFKGSAFMPGDPDNIEISLPPRISFSEISLNGGGSEVVFNRLTGETDEYGYVILSLYLRGEEEQTRRININRSGLVSID